MVKCISIPENIIPTSLEKIRRYQERVAEKRGTERFEVVRGLARVLKRVVEFKKTTFTISV
jgi:predicted nuclease of restriction endonuclease-like RecB superfamily